jgi:hypothetical protein
MRRGGTIVRDPKIVRTISNLFKRRASGVPEALLVSQIALHRRLLRTAVLMRMIDKDLATVGNGRIKTASAQTAFWVVCRGPGFQELGGRWGHNSDRRSNGDGGEYGLAEHSFSPHTWQTEPMVSLPTREEISRVP